MTEPDVDRYRVRPTRQAIKLGYKLAISPGERLEIIEHLKELRFWPDNTDEFDYEQAFGVYEFKFNTKDHWVRVFIHQEDSEFKEMVVLHVTCKKQNRLTGVEKIAVSAALLNLKREYLERRKTKSKLTEAHKFTALEGGKK